MDDLFAISPTSRLSPTLQLNNIKSQQQYNFDINNDEDEINDDELLEAFNKHMESSSNQMTNSSPVLVLTNRVNTQNEVNIQTTDLSLPKFELEFSFDDLDNSNERKDNANET